MKSFINSIPNEIRIIGFDLDGTLYDEFEFVSQAYQEVAKIISKYVEIETANVYSQLCQYWLKYGSSANIFQMVVEDNKGQVNENLIKECVSAYRCCDFSMSISKRTEMTLDYLVEQEYKLFLITDGDSNLQRRKIKALSLERWFDYRNIAISGDYGRNKQKPSTYMCKHVSVINECKGDVLYRGDRDIDEYFSKNSGFKFMYLKNMNIQ